MARTWALEPAVPAALTLACVWSLYLPLGLQYLLFLGAGLAALADFARARRRTELRAEFGHELQRAAVAWPLLFLLWTALSAAWSPAPPRDIVGQVWHNAMPLCMLWLAYAMRAADARMALRHFIGISVAVALLLPWLGPELIGGNKRIAYSLLLALATVLALAEALALTGWRHRAPWLLAMVVCGIGLALQDRRTGMLALPLLLAALACLRCTGWRQRAALLAALWVAALVVGWATGNVQSRFDEGLRELRQYPAEGEVATSMGMRLRLFELSLEMVRESPWLGHGAGSWLGLWQARVQGGGLLAAHTTPHNEYLLVAVQGGVIGLLLFLLALGACGVAAWRRGGAAPAAFLVWLAFAFAACFNVVLRDAKFALPLLILGAVAWAASRPSAR